ncbi:MAG TPA: nucleotidyl transferase AbiEii/AbiGii toxin family protein [Candidatus Ozemobacteraceae bacterium]|nr:nucleotidyl transferase AbiEii/AbiGii toxin family protein [Candidatus Ozemobacteraceae bacterium]
MNSAIKSMLERYSCVSIEDYRNALKEIVQELALLGLYRGGFFSHAAFYGGTALRIFYGLDRFSEDLDFTLLQPDKTFELARFIGPLRDELAAFGLEMTVEEKVKSNRSAVRSAFIKGGTQLHLIKIASIKPPVSGVNPDEQLRIKIELDTDPPPGAGFELKYQLLPVPYSVRMYDAPSLFAGKIHALLCRGWQNRVKGRDFYDYAWYLARRTPLNMEHLVARLRQTGYLAKSEELAGNDLVERLLARFQQVDFQQARKDVELFVSDPKSLALWSFDFFSGITRDFLRLKTP